MITIIDYGIGNLRSIEKAFQTIGTDVLRTDCPEDLERADHLILPGVGAFGACADEIRRRGLERPIQRAVESGKPFLGVCVGMQLLFDYSEEMGRHRGLGILPGKVIRFNDRYTSENTSPGRSVETSTGTEHMHDPPLKIPHMGWNTIDIKYSSPLLSGIDPESYFYFVHSFYAVPSQMEDILASTTYGMAFASIVNRNNVFGVQFHPEKSQQKGLRILKNFADIASSAPNTL